jgi:hypothetical protein
VSASGSTTRTGHITVTGNGGSVQFTVSQGACTYSFTPPTASFSSSGGSGLTVALAAGCAWAASSDQPWLTITSATSGTGNVTMTYSVAANATATIRTGHITATGNGGSAQFTVTQDPPPCNPYVVTPQVDFLPTAGGSRNATLTAGCAWTASSDQPWLTISPTSGSSNATIVYTWQTLAGTTNRIATVTITGAGGTAKIVLNQGPPTLITVTATPNPAPYRGTSGCNGLATWLYDETLSELRGVTATVTRIVDRIDGSIVNDVTVNHSIQGGTNRVYNYKWCYPTAAAGAGRAIQSTFSGSDVNGNTFSVTGPVVTLLDDPGTVIAGPAGAPTVGTGSGGATSR